ncbi:MAG: hypothetical protein Q9194_002074 [Teloschistes cf. exilis]
MAMMASASSGNPYNNLNNTQIEQDLIDPDDANINDLDDPIEPTSDRAPLTGNIQTSSRNPLPQSYLNSSIPGEDRRAPTNTIDESVWDTLSRDLLAVWEKMRQVLWPKYLLGGFLRRGGGIGGAERAEGDSLAGGFRGIAGRWPDADVVLQGGMSEGLRDWDLWGPLIFCLLLSLLLSMTASSDQKTAVFSGVFAMIWVGEAVVTAQIKLLGGNISFFQSVCIIGYTLFPLVVAALLSAVHLPMVARIPVYIVLVAWSLAAGISILVQSGRDLEQVIAGDLEKTSSHAPDSSHLHPFAQDSTSDNETSERPVREKLKKASIQSMPKNNATSRVSDPSAEDKSDFHPASPLRGDSPLDRTPSPSAEPRGRLSRKRSYDDSKDTAATAADLSRNGRALEEDVKHIRKRSRDVRVAQPQDKKLVPTEQPLPEGDVTDDQSPDNEAPDKEMEDTVRSPGKKRSGEELDTDSHREQKIAATEEAKAHRRSEESERSQAPYRGDDTGPVSQKVQQEHQASNKMDQSSNQVASSTENSESTQGESRMPPPAKDQPVDTAAQKATSKVPGGFAASGFAAMSGSNASPFGNPGAASSSVFRSTPYTTSTANGRPNGFNFVQVNTQAAGDMSASPFLSSSAATSASPFAAVNGAVAKQTSFGSSTFGSGFANSAIGGSKLKSFAAPTGDLAAPKRPESSGTFISSKASDMSLDPPAEKEEDGSAGEAANEGVGVDNDEVDSRFQQQEVDTGEGGESSIFVAQRAQLYHYYQSGWHEKGKGTFKLNVGDDNAKEKKARFIMRAHQTYRVLLNQPVFKQMQVGDPKGGEPQGKRFSFAVIDDGKPVPHIVKLSDEGEAKALFNEVLRIQQDLDSQA